MTIFRDDTSFPFLKIAREHGVSYRQIMQEVTACELALRFADITGKTAAIEYSMMLSSPLRDRQRAIYAAISAENRRRQFVQEQS